MMDWFSGLTELVEGLVAWGTLLGWLDNKFGLADLILAGLRRLGRRLK